VWAGSAKLYLLPPLRPAACFFARFEDDVVLPERDVLLEPDDLRELADLRELDDLPDFDDLLELDDFRVPLFLLSLRLRVAAARFAESLRERFFAAADFLVPPPPDFSPPPLCLFTVAHALLSASFLPTPRFS
jgi:hypothetical protein